MLQIITGKYFRSVPLHETTRRGVFYSNYHMRRSNPCLSTPVGKLLGSTNFEALSTLTYEMVERLEAVRLDGSPSNHIATSGTELANDFAAVISFALNVTCTPDQDLTRRLIATGSPALRQASVPSRYIPRIFDAFVPPADDDEQILAEFLQRLVDMGRSAFEGAMRAIRRYVIATYRISDDVDLAYTLFVAAMESLAQDFDGHNASWADYEETKRDAIDEVLTDVAEETANRIREALLRSEHHALRKRYRQFVLAHIAPSFFRSEAEVVKNPICRSDLSAALDQAYVIRSRYVHTLRDIPKMVAVVGKEFETVEADDKPTLTFCGLARVARHVILEFVQRSAKKEDHTFDYRDVLPGVVQMRMAPQYWIGNASGFAPTRGREYLTGYLQQLSEALSSQPGAVITDVRDVLAKVESAMSGLAKPAQRIPSLALYALFHRFAPASHHRPESSTFLQRHAADLESPTIEGFVFRLLTDRELPWNVEQSQSLVDDYFAQKHRKHALCLTPLFEAALLLRLAEELRQTGEYASAQRCVALAVDNHPGHARLRAFEVSILADSLSQIDWKKILLPQMSPGDSSSSTETPND
jgi:hypothetical protein